MLSRIIGRQHFSYTNLNSKVHVANMGPMWGPQDPGGPQVGQVNLAIWKSYADVLWHMDYVTRSYYDWTRTCVPKKFIEFCRLILRKFCWIHRIGQILKFERCFFYRYTDQSKHRFRHSRYYYCPCPFRREKSGTLELSSLVRPSIRQSGPNIAQLSSLLMDSLQSWPVDV